MYRNRNNSVILPSCARFRFLIFFAYLSCLEPIQSFCTCVHMCIKVCVLRVFGQTIFRYIYIYIFFFFDDDRFRFLERISIWWIFFLFGERVFGKNCYEKIQRKFDIISFCNSWIWSFFMKKDIWMEQA